MLKTRLIQLLLFVLTVITTTIAGAEWTWGSSFVEAFRPMGWHEFLSGFYYSLPFLGVLTVHEFGHYFVAKAHRVEVTLPYYLPMWLGGITGIGTMGAFIRIKGQINSRQQFFDIGIAGPLAGFMVALVLLYYGFSHLPSLDYLFQIHPEYKVFGSKYAAFVYQSKQAIGQVGIGHTLLFDFMKERFANDPALVPHPYEMIHYPLLLAGYLSLFFTALNLMPIGQLDGGHIMYGLIGKKNFDIVSPVLFVIFITYAGLGLWTVADYQSPDSVAFALSIGKTFLYVFFLYLCFGKVNEDSIVSGFILALCVFLLQFGIYHFWHIEGYSGFLAFGLLLGRFLGVYHPTALVETPLDAKRQVLGWLALVIFVLCFSPKPFI